MGVAIGCSRPMPATLHICKVGQYLNHRAAQILTLLSKLTFFISPYWQLSPSTIPHLFHSRQAVISSLLKLSPSLLGYSI